MTAIRSLGTAIMITTSLLAATQASAQVPTPGIGISLGAKVTTLGYGPEVGIAFGSRLGARVGLNLLNLGRDFDFSDIDYGAKLRFRTITGLLDLYLLGPIRLSGGMVLNNNKLELSADPTIAVDIGNTTYQATDVGLITATIDYSRKTAPYVGLGIGGRGKVGFILELGIMMTGSPRLSYTATTTLTGAAATAFNTQVTNETAQVQADINDTSVLKTYPVVGIGLQFRI